MILGVAAAFVAVAVFSLSSLECSPTTCRVSSTYISLHYSLNSGVLTGEMSVSLFLFLFSKEVHLVSYFLLAIVVLLMVFRFLLLHFLCCFFLNKKKALGLF